MLLGRRTEVTTNYVSFLLHQVEEEEGNICRSEEAPKKMYPNSSRIFIEFSSI
jgi:hypothetical protein